MCILSAVSKARQKAIKDHKGIIIFMISKGITKVQNSIYHIEYKISFVSMMPE